MNLLLMNERTHATVHCVRGRSARLVMKKNRQGGQTDERT